MTFSVIIEDVTGIGHTSAQAIICDNESAKKQKSGKTRKGNTRTLQSPILLVVIYHIPNDGVVFKDLGADYYNQFNKERKINTYLKKLKALGWEASAVAS